MGAKIRKVLKRNKLLKGHRLATLSRGHYLVGSAEFCLLTPGLNRANNRAGQKLRGKISQHFSNGPWFQKHLSCYIPPSDSAAQKGMVQNPQKTWIPPSLVLQVAGLAKKGECLGT